VVCRFWSKSSIPFSAIISYPTDLLEVTKIIKDKPIEASSTGQPIECSESYTCPIGYLCNVNANCNESGCSNFQPGGICSAAPPAGSSQSVSGDLFIQFWLPETGFDNTTGKVILSGGVSGQGIKTTPPVKPVMAQIIFKAKKIGEAKLDFTENSLILRNSDSVNILGTKNGRTIYIKDQKETTVKGDLNDDNVVDAKDFSILLSKWGSNDPKFDLNGDGTVNIYDFSAFMANWKR
jgi:hypothetical protein